MIFLFEENMFLKILDFYVAGESAMWPYYRHY